MVKKQVSNGFLDLDVYIERMEISRVQRAMEGVRRLEESHGARRTPDNVREVQNELRRSMKEWAGL